MNYFLAQQADGGSVVGVTENWRKLGSEWTFPVSMSGELEVESDPDLLNGDIRMDVEVSACELLNLLRGFKPRGRTKPFREPNVRATAGGNMLILMGSFDNSTSIPVKVNLPGSVDLPLDPTLRLLSTYKGGEVIRIRTDGGGYGSDK